MSAESDDDEEAVAEGQLSPERYAEMSAAEDLILTISGTGTGKTFVEPRLPGARARWHGRDGHGQAMRGGPLVASFPRRGRRSDHAGHIDRPVDPLPGGRHLVPVALGGRGQGVRHRQAGEEVVSVARIADQGDDEA